MQTACLANGHKEHSQRNSDTTDDWLGVGSPVRVDESNQVSQQLWLHEGKHITARLDDRSADVRSTECLEKSDPQGRLLLLELNIPSSAQIIKSHTGGIATAEVPQIILGQEVVVPKLHQWGHPTEGKN